MFPEIERFGKWLRCRSPHATTHVHYTSYVRFFFTWADKPRTPSPSTTLMPMFGSVVISAPHSPTQYRRGSFPSTLSVV
jgi:hypothetical protein